MSPGDWRDRISIDPSIHHGAPCIRDTRVTVSVLVGSIAEGDKIDELLHAYPHLTEDDICSALKFAAEAVNNADFLPLSGKGVP